MICIGCVCLCVGGCCVAEKIGEALGRAIGEALAQVLTEHYLPDLMGESLTNAERVVLDLQGARPEVWPWCIGAEIARFATQRLGLGPTSPLGLVLRLLQSLSEFGDWIWRALRWVYST